MACSIFQLLCAFVLLAVTCNAFLQPQNLKPQRYAASKLSMVADGRRPFIAGNWKMNPTSLEEAKTLAAKVAELTKENTEVEMAVFAPHPFIYPVAKELEGSNVVVGAETIFTEDKGAYTGAVSATMVKSMGGKWVLAGHSERRVLFNTDDDSVNRQVLKILNRGMGCILCIGESQAEYDAGLNQEICTVQLAKDLKDVTPEQMKNVVIAYEPVWAIGTGLTATPEIAQNVHASIRAWVAKKFGEQIAKETRIQYGGSVTPETVDELMACPDIDGALVGGASLDAEKFARICNFEMAATA